MKKLLIISLLFFISLSSFSQNWDIDLLKEINIGRNKNLDQGFNVLTQSVYPLSAGFPLILFSTALIRKDSVNIRKSIVMATTLLTSAILTTSLKYIVNRPRPYQTYPIINNYSIENSSSFPSGHVTIAFATATSVSLAYPKWYIIAPSLLWASAVGYSRLHLGVHYPSDVLVGAIIGVGSSYLNFKINRWLKKKF